MGNLTHANRIVLNGQVQGVGFRPFVFRLAQRFRLVGWVRNNLGQVEILAQGDEADLAAFETALIQEAPEIAAPQLQSCYSVELQPMSEFIIRSSLSEGSADIHIPPDYFTCSACQQELRDPSDRRHAYPFINCTQCGPRYTLIEALPYDRANTSMREFDLCPACLKEYEDPLNRRFHAEPLACPVCGPEVRFVDRSQDGLNIIDSTPHAIDACIHALKQGEIVALKGVGGYHLLCDAFNETAIRHLRQRKGRPDKPLAVLFPETGVDGLEQVRQQVDLSDKEASLLRSPMRPIVLAEKKTILPTAQSVLSEAIAPGLNEIGVMLPYSPLHHLILDGFGKAVVATSANLSGEPVLTDAMTVERRLAHVTQHFVHHNRRIVRPADDPVVRLVHKQMRPLRLGRGNAPLELRLPFRLTQPLLACGGQMKNTLALGWEDRLVVSPHIGDLDSPRSMEVFEQTAEDLQCLYAVKAEKLVADQHPGYASTRWAKNQKLPVNQIQHHRAHATAAVLENLNDDPWLVFCWDGTGFADPHDTDAAIWGGETFYGHPGNWQRVATFRPFHIPGGDRAAREIWRSAAALCWETGKTFHPKVANNNALEFTHELAFVEKAWRQRINSPATTSVGRLFDAAAALIGLRYQTSFDGQAPMMLEQISEPLQTAEPVPMFYRESQGLWQADWGTLIPDLQDSKRSVEQRASRFHSRLAQTILQQVELISQSRPVHQVGFGGGVFQNRKLTEYVVEQLEKKGIRVSLPLILPVNDAAISAGQLVEAAWQNRWIELNKGHLY